MVSLVSQRVLLICGGMQGCLILLITDKLQNQFVPQPLEWRGWDCLGKLAEKVMIYKCI